MNVEVIDALLTAMIQSAEGVSDLLFAVGKPPLVEKHGTLEEFPIDTPDGVLTLEQIQVNLGSPDAGRRAPDPRPGAARLVRLQLQLTDLARFRVNIFKQNGRQSIVMRKLQTVHPDTRSPWSCRRSSGRW